MSDYVAVNRANWDSRVPHRLAAYGLELFADDPEHLSGMVRFDRPPLGVRGHLSQLQRPWLGGTSAERVGNANIYRFQGVSRPLASEQERHILVTPSRRPWRRQGSAAIGPAALLALRAQAGG